MNFIETIDRDHNYFERQYQSVNLNEYSTYFSLDEFNTMVKDSPNYVTLLNSNVRT